MSRARTLTAAVGAMATMAGMMIGSASMPAQASARASAHPADTPLVGSVPPFTRHALATANVAGSKRLSIQLWLRPRMTAAQRFATAVSTPGSALFHHYVSPDGYAARFGATAGQAGKVESWLRAEGFTSVRANSERSYVRATAAASKIDAAFHVQLKLYPASAVANAGPYALRANDRAISLPSALASSVLGVTGLDNAAPILPLAYETAKPGGGPARKAPTAARLRAPCSHYYGQHMSSGLPAHFGEKKFPTELCGYSAGQLRAAYDATSRSTGTGQTIALVELGLTKDMFLTLKDYAMANGMPAPSAQRYTQLSLGRGTACGDEFDVEEQLDVESSYDMAPAASQFVVGGDSCNDGDFGLQGLFNADLAVINGTGGHPLASAASNSWEGGDESQAPFLTNIEHAYLMQAAAEGVGMYFSSGDGSGVESPSSDPFAVAVGGTTLGLGKSSNRLFETGWSTGISALKHKRWVFQGEQGAAGGGPSLLWQEPAYQQGVVPASLATAPGDRGGAVRVVPDISADADPFTGFAVGLLTFHKKKHLPPTFAESDIGGTSLSTPTVAGIVTAAQQGQSGPFGLINPAIYKLAGTSAFFDPLPLTSSSPKLYLGMSCDAAACGAEALTTFDDQSFSMLGYTGQVTLKGYDNMSGIGTPSGQFMTSLRALEK
jgi:subtilase family serine protease